MKYIAMIMILVPGLLFSQQKIEFKPGYGIVNGKCRLVSKELKIDLVGVNTINVSEGSVSTYHSLISEDPISVEQYVPFLNYLVEEGKEIPAEWISLQVQMEKGSYHAIKGMSTESIESLPYAATAAYVQWLTLWINEYRNWVGDFTVPGFRLPSNEEMAQHFANEAISNSYNVGKNSLLGVENVRGVDYPDRKVYVIEYSPEMTGGENVFLMNGISIEPYKASDDLSDNNFYIAISILGRYSGVGN